MRFNEYDERRSALSLVSALGGKATEVLKLVGAGGSIALDDLVGALELRFGNADLRQVHGLVLNSRRQLRDESLQQLYIDICRLARLAHPGAVNADLEGLIVDAFSSSIRHRKTQMAVRMWREDYICSAKRGPPIRSRGPMMQHNSGSPFKRIGIDITGPMTNGGNRVMRHGLFYQVAGGNSAAKSGG